VTVVPTSSHWTVGRCLQPRGECPLLKRIQLFRYDSFNGQETSILLFDYSVYIVC
jgi:hypothetical protein